jgi:hypothetical protein
MQIVECLSLLLFKLSTVRARFPSIISFSRDES